MGHDKLLTRMYSMPKTLKINTVCGLFKNGHINIKLNIHATIV